MPTLFVEADEPLLIFPSTAAAEHYLEVQDVRAGIYPRASGPLGDVHDVIARGSRVVIQQSAAPPKPNDLKLLLSRYLETLGEPASKEADLATLVALVEAHEEAFWSEHDPYGGRFSTRVPLWGCLAVILALTSVIHLSWRYVANGN